MNVKGKVLYYKIMHCGYNGHCNCEGSMYSQDCLQCAFGSKENLTAEGIQQAKKCSNAGRIHYPKKTVPAFSSF